VKRMPRQVARIRDRVNGKDPDIASLIRATLAVIARLDV
jgi:hypothetical protein